MRAYLPENGGDDRRHWHEGTRPKAVLLPARQAVWVLERGKRIDQQGGTIPLRLAPLNALHRSNTRDM